MASPAELQSCPAISHALCLQDCTDDWVSLMLPDAGLDAEVDSDLSLASLANLPLPDPVDMVFSDIDDGSSDTALLDAVHLFPPDSVANDEAYLCQRSCPDTHETCPSSMFQMLDLPDASEIRFSDAPGRRNEHASQKTSDQSVGVENSGPTVSGLSYASSTCADLGSSIPHLDSGSDADDDLYYFVSNICSEDSGSAEPAATRSTAAFVKSEIHGAESISHEQDASMLNIQVGTASSQQELDTVSRIVSFKTEKTSRKRKILDGMSRSSTPEKEGASVQTEDIQAKDEDEEKRRARLMRNRESAQLSRQRKKIYVDELEERIKTMASTIAELNNTINLISSENINLRRQLGLFGSPAGQGAGMSSLPSWIGSYPAGTVMGGRFVLPSSQVPLVPIPRWKSQHVNTSFKTTKSEIQAKASTEKRTKRPKKIAGITAAGFLFFIFIMFPFNFNIPVFKHKMDESNVWSTSPWHIKTDSTVVRAGGRVLTGLSENHVPRYEDQGAGWMNRDLGKNPQMRNLPAKWKAATNIDTSYNDKQISKDSASEKNGSSMPLGATLFVPRHDGLVRIQGNLIIHSVLAGNKAALEENKSMKMQNRLMLDANLKAVALKAAPEEKGALVELQRALSKKARFNSDDGGLRSLQEDGTFQQWFLEDLSGPVFSSGLCTEVFQFEISPSSSHTVEGEPLINKTMKPNENVPRKAGRSVSRMGKNANYAVPLPPAGHKAVAGNVLKKSNSTDNKNGCNRGDLGKQKQVTSSVVVSVLAGSEFGEKSELIAGGNSPLKIFVVVLIDNVKYVTYSCRLPSAVSKPQYEVIVA